jgi:pimeloyl-CoA dehydrogenase
MDFELNADQLAMRDSVGRLLRERYTLETRRASAVTSGDRVDFWPHLVDLGLQGLLVPERCGGIGGMPSDLLAVLPEFGRFLVLEPFLASGVLATTALSQLDPAAVSERLLRMAEGTLRMTWAHDDKAGLQGGPWTTAQQSDTGWVLSGAKFNVLYATQTDGLIVSATIANTSGQPDVLGLFTVDTSAAGLDMRKYRLVDDTPAAEVTMTSVAATPLCLEVAHAATVIQNVTCIGIAAVCAEAVGLMEGAFSHSREYLGQRQQFGRPLLEQQVLRHKLAEMAADIEISRSMAIGAAIAADALMCGMADEAHPGMEFSQAKLVISGLCRRVCETAVQLHGAMGMTEEVAVGHYLRRAVCLEQFFGDGRVHAERLISC